jgi:hypothetical protein
MFDELFPESAEVALDAQVKRAPEPPKPTQRFSAWGLIKAAPKGLAAGSAQGLASGADLGKAIADKVPANVSGPLGKIPIFNAIASTMQVGVDILNPKEGQFTSEVGASLRNVAQDYTPDPQTAHASESAVFNLFRVGSKALTAAAVGGNIPGAIVAGAEEGLSTSADLANQGVDIKTRSKVGAVVAATNAAGFALPVAGKTWVQTAGLALAGGPVSFVAQQEATRKILADADYSQLADQYDPFDPVGLALSTVLPLGFGALAMRGVKTKTTAKGPMPDVPPKPVEPPIPRPEPELVDAARVNLLRENADVSNPKPGDMKAADEHSTAYAKAMEQQAEGKPVSIMDVAPKIEPIAGNATDTPNFKAWFGESKVVDDAGAPMVVYRGEPKNYGKLSDDGEIYFTNDPTNASEYAGSGAGANVAPTYISLKNPLIVDAGGKSWVEVRAKAIAEAKAAGNDGVILRNVVDNVSEASARTSDTYIAFDPKQIKSAIGNSGKFDPNSGSLTDNPIADWGAGLTKAIADMQAEIDKLKPKQAKAPADTAQPATKGIANVQDAQAPAGTKTQAAPDQAGAAAQGNATPPTDVPGAGAADVQTNGVNALDSRLADIEARNPAAMDAMIATEFDDAGKPTNSVSVRDFLEQVKRDAKADEQDAGLIEVAANCFLNGGL